MHHGCWDWLFSQPLSITLDGDLVVFKFCKYHPCKRCYHRSCGLIDDMGHVFVCPLFGGGNFFASRKVVVPLGSGFSKHKGGR